MVYGNFFCGIFVGWSFGGDSRGYRSTAILREERCKHSSFAGRRDHMEFGGEGETSHISLRCFLSSQFKFRSLHVLSEKGFFDGFSFAASYRMATSSAGERSISNWLSIAVFAERIPTFAMGLVIDDCGQAP